MSLDLLVALVGSFLSLLLIINAFFTRQTLQAITEVRLELVKLNVKHDATEERSRVNASEVVKIRDRLHTLEGSQAQITKFLEAYEGEIIKRS